MNASYDPNCYRCRETADRPRAGVTSLCQYHKDERALVLMNENAVLREKLTIAEDAATNYYARVAELEAERDEAMRRVDDGWSTALAAVKALLAERDRLREALRALCLHADEWRANGWVPATGALDDAHAALGVKP